MNTGLVGFLIEDSPLMVELARPSPCGLIGSQGFLPMSPDPSEDCGLAAAGAAGTAGARDSDEFSEPVRSVDNDSPDDIVTGLHLEAISAEVDKA